MIPVQLKQIELVQRLCTLIKDYPLKNLDEANFVLPICEKYGAYKEGEEVC